MAQGGMQTAEVEREMSGGLLFQKTKHYGAERYSSKFTEVKKKKSSGSCVGLDSVKSRRRRRAWWGVVRGHKERMFSEKKTAEAFRSVLYRAQIKWGDLH